MTGEGATAWVEEEEEEPEEEGEELYRTTQSPAGVPSVRQLPPLPPPVSSLPRSQALRGGA